MGSEAMDWVDVEMGDAVLLRAETMLSTAFENLR